MKSLWVFHCASQGTAEDETFLAVAFILVFGTALTGQGLKRLVPQWNETLDDKEQRQIRRKSKIDESIQL